MGRIACGTIVAKSHLALARVLASSFHRWHPSIPFYVLLTDEVDGRFDPRDEPFELLALDDVAVPAGMRFWYRQQELTYAMAPNLIAHLLDQGFDQVGYLKQESLVVGSLEATLASLASAPITLTPHLLTPLQGALRIDRELNVLQSGVYNAGFVGVAESVVARRFLGWWQDRVHRHCRHDVAGGIHYEQRWLDLVPLYFPSTQLRRDPGCNVGHWNMAERHVLVDGDDVTVDGAPCSLVRFSGYDPDRPDEMTRHRRATVEALGPGAEIFRRYQSLLEDAGHEAVRDWPYAFSRFSNGVPIPDVARQLYGALDDGPRRFADPFDSTGPSSFYQWLGAAPEPSTGPGPPLTRLWAAVHQQRPDLQEAFPVPRGADGPAFARWTVTSGHREHDIADVFALPGVA
ncbi:MAG: hypothetical protein ABIS47_03915 [Acidimicrobiales bacterium]